MDHEYDTQSLAEAYEAQGYQRDALEIYVRMNQKFPGRNPEIPAACSRLEKILAEKNAATGRPRPELMEKKSLPALAEQWLTLLLLTHRKTALETLALTVNQHSMKK